jgi:hypothetical protein
VHGRIHDGLRHGLNLAMEKNLECYKLSKVQGKASQRVVHRDPESTLTI